MRGRDLELAHVGLPGPITVGLLALCLLLLVGCRSDVVYGDQVVLTGTGYLDCSLECMTRGSCVPAATPRQHVVYVGALPGFPGVSSVAFQELDEGTPVEVLDTELVAGIEQRDNRAINIRFYQVRTRDDTLTGWVPGFCIANQAP